MIGDWEIFQIIGQNAVAEMFGTYAIFALVLCLILFIIMLGYGLDFRYALLFNIPIIGGFTVAGWFPNSIVIHLALLIAGLFYGYVIIQLINN